MACNITSLSFNNDDGAMPVSQAKKATIQCAESSPNRLLGLQLPHAFQP
jgi:hypothetical protein